MRTFSIIKSHGCDAPHFGEEVKDILVCTKKSVLRPSFGAIFELNGRIPIYTMLSLSAS